MVQYLPPGSRQREQAEAKVRELSGHVEATGGRKGESWWKCASALGPVGVVAAILGKAKLLLLGSTKLGTLLSFVAGFSVYWTLWGWRFALCFLISIYIHEMGHVATLQRFGIPRLPRPSFRALGCSSG
jgi:hypothetical protein